MQTKCTACAAGHATPGTTGHGHSHGCCTRRGRQPQTGALGHSSSKASSTPPLSRVPSAVAAAHHACATGTPRTTQRHTTACCGPPPTGPTACSTPAPAAAHSSRMAMGGATSAAWQNLGVLYFLTTACRLALSLALATRRTTSLLMCSTESLPKCAWRMRL